MGFLRYQLDLPWLLIRSVQAIGGIRSYRNYRAEFFMRRYRPYLAARAATIAVQPRTADCPTTGSATPLDVRPTELYPARAS
jgi:hypothetical protein